MGARNGGSLAKTALGSIYLFVEVVAIRTNLKKEIREPWVADSESSGLRAVVNNCVAKLSRELFCLRGD